MDNLNTKLDCLSCDAATSMKGGGQKMLRGKYEYAGMAFVSVQDIKCVDSERFCDVGNFYSNKSGHKVILAHDEKCASLAKKYLGDEFSIYLIKDQIKPAGGQK